jgi:uncharacterized membrane protein
VGFQAVKSLLTLDAQPTTSNAACGGFAHPCTSGERRIPQVQAINPPLTPVPYLGCSGAETDFSRSRYRTETSFLQYRSWHDHAVVQRAAYSGFAMTLLSALFLFPLVVGNKVRLAGLRSNWRGLWLRGFLEALFMVCKLSALVYWQAPYVAGFQRFSLVLSIIGGRVFFKEAEFPRRFAAGILILAGIILIAWLEKD